MHLSLLLRYELHMGYKVRVTESAHESVMSSVGYIAEVLCSPRAAANLLETYNAALKSLQNNPTFYPLSTTATERYGRRIYRRAVGNYQLFYYVDEEAFEVVVFSFLHGRQEASTRLMQDYRSS